MFRCDRCKVEAEAVEAENYAQDWDTVTVSALPPYDLCEPCSRLLFGFLAGEAVPAVPKDGAGSSQIASPEAAEKRVP